MPRRSQERSANPRRAAAAGIVATAVAAIAIAYVTFARASALISLRQPRALPAVLAVDSERAAAIQRSRPPTRESATRASPNPVKTHRTESKRRSVTASQNRSAPRARHAPTASGSHAPATTPPPRSSERPPLRPAARRQSPARPRNSASRAKQRRRAPPNAVLPSRGTAAAATRELYYVTIAQRSLPQRRPALRPTRTGRSAGGISRRWPGEDEAMNRIELEPVDRVEITLLMDNVTDPLLVDRGSDRADELAQGDPRRTADRPGARQPDHRGAGRADRRAWVLGAGADREGGPQANAAVRHRGLAERDGGEHAPAAIYPAEDSR